MIQKIKYLGLPELMKMNNGAPVTAKNWKKRRGEILELLQQYEFGTLPPEPEYIRQTDRVEYNCDYDMSGEARTNVEVVTLELGYPAGKYSFPIKIYRPIGAEKPPVIIMLNLAMEGFFSVQAPPQVLAKGVAVVGLGCNDISLDGPGFDKGLPALLYPEGRKAGEAAKFMLWGRAMGYVRSYLEQRGDFDMTRVCAAGCSRFGKTALAAGIFDEGFTHVAAIESGCAGASIHRGKIGEDIRRISTSFPYWFCEKFAEYGGREDELPFDAHFLIGAIAPRKVLITDAYEDFWSDPFNCYLACIAASPAYEALGVPGFIYPDGDKNPGPRYAKPGEYIMDGNIGYFMRSGGHGCNDEDWAAMTEFLLK